MEKNNETVTKVCLIYKHKLFGKTKKVWHNVTPQQKFDENDIVALIGTIRKVVEQTMSKMWKYNKTVVLRSTVLQFKTEQPIVLAKNKQNDNSIDDAQLKPYSAFKNGKEYYKYLKSVKRCVKCRAKLPANSKHACCKQCRIKMNKYNHTVRRPPKTTNNTDVDNIVAYNDEVPKSRNMFNTYKEYYEYLKSNKFCVKCRAKIPARRHNVCCAKCCRKMAKYKANKRHKKKNVVVGKYKMSYEEHKRLGLCVKCGNVVTGGKHATCNVCREKMRVAGQQRTLYRQQHNLCTSCGTKLPNKKHRHCVKCRNKIKRNAQKK